MTITRTIISHYEADIQERQAKLATAEQYLVRAQEDDRVALDSTRWLSGRIEKMRDELSEKADMIDGIRICLEIQQQQCISVDERTEATLLVGPVLEESDLLYVRPQDLHYHALT